MSGDFLSRWSRRKLEIKRAEDVPAPAPEAVPPPADAPGAEELSPEELAALPTVESLTAESDIAAFLRKGVPQALRNAALRRVWALDPEIRDYVGDARDYAYDWNVPGGVPGSGPLDPGTDLARMVDDVFGRRPQAKPAPPATEVAARDDGDVSGAQAVAAGDVPAPETDDGTQAEVDAAPAATRSTSGDPAGSRAKTRHGGAKPV